MTNRNNSYTLRAMCLSLGAVALPASAAQTSYEMSLTTHAGMGAGGMASVFSAMAGGKSSSVSLHMDLRLTSPTDLPGDYQAAHTVPDAMRIGPQLPLTGERRRSGGGGSDGEPDGRVLIYWGCSPTVQKGQPEVIDFRSLAGKVPPEIQAMARQSRSQGKDPGRDASLPPRTIGWPQGDRDYRGIPDNASAVGEHLVKASFMKDDIRFALTPALDFLEPMNLKARSSDLKAPVPLAWDALTRARGYDLQAVAAKDEKEMVIWMADRNKRPMLPASQRECTIPEGIFAKAEMAMVTGTAHGPVQGYSFPPQKPGEKKPLIWTATVRVLGHDSALLGMEAAATSGSARESAMPGVGDVLKGLFGR
ncbi:MAG TPA: hypothetical protein PK225_12730 [Azonexus sp.]|nr:hypothetical protein [Azonexus sp.]